MLINGGATIPPDDSKRTLIFQSSLLKAQIALEDSFYDIAKATGEVCLLLCDRGVMDGRGYVTEEMWGRLLEDIERSGKFNGGGGKGGGILGMDKDDCGKLRDERYEMICHLVTAAEGADEYYTLENNKARSEDGILAREIDYRLRKAWVGHPHLRIVDNRTGFKEKINRVYRHVAALFGLRDGRDEESIKRKFLVRVKDMKRGWEGRLGIKEFMVEQTFLESGDYGQGVVDNDWDEGVEGAKEGVGGGGGGGVGGKVVKVEESVRRRGRNGFHTFVHQVRKTTLVDEDKRDVVELKRQITNREYLSLLSHGDPARRSVRIKRQCFLYRDQYFVIDTPLDVHPSVQLLRTHVERDVDRIEVPDWIKIEKEVTGEFQWTLHALSMKVRPVRIIQAPGSSDIELSRPALSSNNLLGTSL